MAAASSPRLPSPPPFTEVQVNPKSPTVGASSPEDAEKIAGPALEDDVGSTRRIRPGTKSADMGCGPPLIPLNQVSFVLNQTRLIEIDPLLTRRLSVQ